MAISKLLLTVVLLGVIACLLPRQQAPSFTGTTVFPDKSVKTVDLEDYKGKYLVLLFYPFDFTYVCPTELLAFSDNIAEFKAIDAEVLAVSVDSQFSHLAWMNTERAKGGVAGIEIPLVSDITKEISKAYEVLVTDKSDELWGASLRGLFIIDGKGTIRSFTINDAPVGRSVDEALRTIKALQYTDKHGVVCPANWKPGARTIIPDQVKKEEYFKEL